MYIVVKVLNILQWPILLFLIFVNYEHGFAEQVRFYLLFGSFTFSTTIMMIAMRIHMVSADYVPLVIIGVRVAVTYLLLYFISAGTKGFELVDKKELHSSIPLIALPFTLFTYDNLALNLTIMVPMILISTISVT